MAPVSISRPESVIFDFDGVIVDTEPLHYESLKSVLDRQGIAVSWQEYMRSCIGLDDRSAISLAFHSTGRKLDDRRMRELVDSKEAIFQESIRKGVRAYPGAVSTIHALRASGVPLAICSGALRSDIVPILERLGIARCFHTIVSADDVWKGKPDPEPYALAFRRLSSASPGLSGGPGKSLAVEDTPAGILSAKLTGLPVLALTNSFPREELGGATFIADSLEQVRIA